MTRINLLPWREKYIEIQNRRLALFCVTGIIISFFVCLMFRLLFDVYLSRVISGREYLHTELTKSEGKMKEVSSLLIKKDGLLKRIKIIEQLQVRRNLTAQILDGVALSLPNNVTLSELACRADGIKLTGVAASNEDVSKYMNSIEKNSWVSEAVLSEIKNNDQVSSSNNHESDSADTSASVKFVIDINLKVS